MSLSNNTLIPFTPSDYAPISALVEPCFAYEEFGIVAFGPKRLTPAGNERAKRMALPPKSGETKYEMKAVISRPDGTEEIVGFASWSLCVGRKGTEEEKESLGTKEGWAEEEREENERKEEGDEEGFGNPKFRREVMGEMQRILARATEGKDYMTLQLLIVVPEHQRKGIGTMLFKDGLRWRIKLACRLFLEGRIGVLVFIRNLGVWKFRS